LHQWRLRPRSDDSKVRQKSQPDELAVQTTPLALIVIFRLPFPKYRSVEKLNSPFIILILLRKAAADFSRRTLQGNWCEKGAVPEESC